MQTVQQLLDIKGSEVFSIRPDQTMLEALNLLSEKGIGALLVIDDGKVCGILSERDYARKVVLFGRASKDTPVGELMTKQVLFIKPDHTIEECMALMIEKRIRHLPVMDNDQLKGIISIGDILKGVISDKTFQINQLTKYITGSY